MKAASLISLGLTVCVAGFAQSSGFVGHRSEKCLCSGTLLPKLSRRRFKDIQKIVVYQPSPSCGKWDVVITLRSGKNKCLDPAGKQGKKLIKSIREQTPLRIRGRKKKHKKNPPTA